MSADANQIGQDNRAEETRWHKPLLGMGSREELAKYAEWQKLTTGAEIGVQRALFSEQNLRAWPSCKRYYLVDPWEHQENYVDPANRDNAGHDSIYAEARQRMSVFGDRPYFMRNYSTDAARLLPDNSIDFVYLDARHDYVSVMEDLLAWWPKVRDGGIFSGHDFHDAYDLLPKVRHRHVIRDWAIGPDGAKQPQGKAVKSAVLEFAHARNLQVVYTGGSYGNVEFPSWYVRKTSTGKKDIKWSDADDV